MQPVATEAGLMGPGYQGLARSVRPTGDRVPGRGWGGTREDYLGAWSMARRDGCPEGQGEPGAPWNGRAPAGTGAGKTRRAPGRGCLHRAL